MAEFFIRNYPTEAENGSTGKDTLPISATMTRRIWFKAYCLAGQPVTTKLALAATFQGYFRNIRSSFRNAKRPP